MVNLFGNRKKKESATITSTTNTINVLTRLKEQVVLLDKRKIHISKKSKDEYYQAQLYVKKDKRSAMMCLKKKQNYDKEITKIDYMIISLEEQICAIEGASINQQYYSNLKTGTEYLKKQTQTINTDKFEKLVDDMEEQKEEAQCIAEIISAPIHAIMDDESLLDELNKIENEENSPIIPLKTTTNINISAQFPNVPTHVISIDNEANDEKELKQLEKEMSLV